MGWPYLQRKESFGTNYLIPLRLQDLPAKSTGKGREGKYQSDESCKGWEAGR